MLSRYGYALVCIVCCSVGLMLTDRSHTSTSRSPSHNPTVIPTDIYAYSPQNNPD